MRKLKGILWLVALGVLLLLGCRPAAQADIAVRAIEEPAPAQIATPTPIASPTPIPTPTATSTPKPTVTPTPTRTIIRTVGPGSYPEPQPTYPPNMDLSVPSPPTPPPRLNQTQSPAVTGIAIAAEGPTTAGGRISIARKVIKLPDDAYIESRIVSIPCGQEPCLKAPIYSIIRGKLRIVFSSVDGEVSQEQIAQGEFGAFDFLKDHLKRKTPSPATSPVLTVAPPAATGPTTK